MENDRSVTQLDLTNSLTNFYSFLPVLVSLSTEVTLGKNSIMQIISQMVIASQLGKRDKYQLCIKSNINEHLNFKKWH